MKLYRFKTRTTSYYFPKQTKESEFIYSLYGNYGSLVARIYWWLFRHCTLLRSWNKIETKEITDFQLIRELLGENSIFGINLGTPSPDQKKSILGYNPVEGRFFAKFACLDNAKKLCENEIYVYNTLSNSGLVPKILDSKKESNFVFLKTECIVGDHIHGQISNDSIIHILTKLCSYHFNKDSNENGLKTCFSHGDFCPWNMLKCNGELKIIDWEMADERSLGHDLFTYIFQTAFLIQRERSFTNILEKNRSLIDRYFEVNGISDWNPYFRDFAQIKVDEFIRKNDSYLTNRYSEALNANL